MTDVVPHEPVFDFAIQVEDTLTRLLAEAEELLGEDWHLGKGTLCPAHVAGLAKLRSDFKSGLNAADWLRRYSSGKVEA